jgi:hypothetical protein
MSVKQMCVTISRFKLNEDSTVREVEDVEISMIPGKPHLFTLNPKSGDPLVLNGEDIISAVKHVSNAEEK